jgi:cysteine synthase A
MGTSPGFLPKTLEQEGNLELIDEIVLVSEEEAFAECRAIARTEGLLVGISASAAVYAARQVRPDLCSSLILIVAHLLRGVCWQLAAHAT